MTDGDILRLSPRDLRRTGDLRSIEVAGVSTGRWTAGSAEFVLGGAEILLRLSFIGYSLDVSRLGLYRERERWRQSPLVPGLFPRESGV
jgi:hypothetical protein